MRLSKLELEAEIAFLNKEIRKLKAKLASYEWQPLSTMPDRGPFMIAQYAPTSWVYHPTYVQPPYYREGEALERHIRMQTKWARCWMAAPEPPDFSDKDWFEQT